MKMTEARKNSEVVLDGVSIEITRKDNSTIRVSFRDTKGNVVEIGKDGYSGMEVLVPAKPEKKKVFQLSGKVIDLTVSENFDSKYEADSRKEMLERKDSEATLSIEEVEMEVA